MHSSNARGSQLGSGVSRYLYSMPLPYLAEPPGELCSGVDGQVRGMQPGTSRAVCTQLREVFRSYSHEANANMC
jgi:hypothetical protein